MRKVAFIFFILFINFSIVFGEEIIATGVADITQGKIGEARQNAIKDALRNAVEKGMGVFIKSESEVKDATLLKDQILSKAEGYISEYNTIKESSEGGVYKVTISAKISLDKIGDDISRFVKKIKSKLSNPSISFVLTTWEKKGEFYSREAGTIIDEKLWKKYPDITIIDSFQQEFKNKGFDLKATDKAREIALSESLTRTSIDINDRSSVRKFAEKEGANFVARGEVRILDIKGSNQTGNYNITAQIGVEIIDVNSGDIVASYTNTASASNSVLDNAKFQSIKKLAILAAKTLAEQTLITWDERANKGRQYVIEFQNVRNMRKQKKQILDLIQGIGEITHQTTTDEGNLAFTILFKGSKSDLETTLLDRMEKIPGMGEDEIDGPFYSEGKLFFKFTK